VPFPCLDRAVQGGFGDLQRPANVHNGVALLVEITGNTELFCGEDFGSAASSASGSGSTQSCLGSLPDKVSLKLR
jgi:hypothetical protein